MILPPILKNVSKRIPVAVLEMATVILVLLSEGNEEQRNIVVAFIRDLFDAVVSIAWNPFALAVRIVAEVPVQSMQLASQCMLISEHTGLRTLSENWP